MNRTRSWRRKQSNRIEKKAYLKIKESQSFNYLNTDDSHKEILQSAKYLKNNMKNCSCYMCGNPRYPKLKHLPRNTDTFEIKDKFK